MGITAPDGSVSYVRNAGDAVEITRGVRNRITEINANTIGDLENYDVEQIDADSVDEYLRNFTNSSKFASAFQNYYVLKRDDEFVALAVVEDDESAKFYAMREARRNQPPPQQRIAIEEVPEEEILPYIRGDKSYWEKYAKTFDTDES